MIQALLYGDRKIFLRNLVLCLKTWPTETQKNPAFLFIDVSSLQAVQHFQEEYREERHVLLKIRGKFFPFLL